MLVCFICKSSQRIQGYEPPCFICKNIHRTQGNMPACFICKSNVTLCASCKSVKICQTVRERKNKFLPSSLTDYKLNLHSCLPSFKIGQLSPNLRCSVEDDRWGEDTVDYVHHQRGRKCSHLCTHAQIC